MKESIRASSFLLILTLCCAWTNPSIRPQAPPMGSHRTILNIAVSAVHQETPSHLQSPLSLTLEQLSSHLGGKGRAQACWEYYRLGLDPIFLLNNKTELIDYEISGNTLWTKEQITPDYSHLPILGTEALYQLSQLPSPSDCSTLTHVSRSMDGTTKLLITLKKDGLQIETVIIPKENKSTLCLSSQVGCRQACVFCATGRMGMIRSLTCDEILSQMYWATQVSAREPSHGIQNIVFMGMGEPADNAAVVVRAANQLVQQFRLAGKHITISTVAPSPLAFIELAQAPVVLAWSVHASNDTVRKKLVPTTRYSMDELRSGLLVALQDRSRSLKSTMLEITLLNDINDSEQHALDLVEFVQPLRKVLPKVVVNIIPWNNIGASSGWAKEFQQPSTERIKAFQQVLTKYGVLCQIRTTRGDDESSACGQLATLYKK